jgi:hypothetical protein
VLARLFIPVSLNVHVATAILCFHALSIAVGDIFASISSKSPFTRFASAMHRATSRRLYCPSANFSHFRRSLRHSRASCPREYVPSSPIPPSCVRVSDSHVEVMEYIQQRSGYRRGRELLGSPGPMPTRPASSEPLSWLKSEMPACAAIDFETRRRVNECIPCKHAKEQPHMWR